MISIKGSRLIWMLVAGAALLAGCAQVPKQAFNAAAASHVKAVVVTQAQNQTEYPAVVVAHPGTSFGLIGALVAAADMHTKSTKLTAALDPAETRIQERFAERLSARLKTAGYQTQVVVLPKDAKEEQALALAKDRAASDAVLLVDLQAGYWAAGPASDYFPRMQAKVKKVDVKTQKVLYEDIISYGYADQHAQSVHLASDSGYRFKDIDVLTADPAKSRKGLYEGLDALAGQIAADLKRN